MVILKGVEDRKKLIISGKIVRKALKAVKKEIKDGVSTLFLNNVAEEVILSYGGTPAFKGYNGFNHSICASINEEAIHGIPSERKLKFGDIVSVDLGVLKNGFYGDACFTTKVGRCTKSTDFLLTTTEKCLYNAIDCCKSGNRLGDISSVIQYTAESNGFSIIKEYGGHGVGKKLHEKPYIPNYGRKNSDILLKPGLVIAIEPILSEGNNVVKVKEDGWTVVTLDNSLTAHFEHTIMITQNEVIILT